MNFCIDSITERSLRLPDTVGEDKVEARFENGVLKVTLPKGAEAARVRKPPAHTARSQSKKARVDSLVRYVGSSLEQPLTCSSCRAAESSAIARNA
jgi:hypothetical protein